MGAFDGQAAPRRTPVNWGFSGDHQTISRDNSPFREGSLSLLTSASSLWTLVGNQPVMRYWSHNFAMDSVGQIMGRDETDGCSLMCYCEDNTLRYFGAPSAAKGSLPVFTLYYTINLLTGAVSMPGTLTTSGTGGVLASGTGGVGYATGAGGAVTQATSKVTAFTLSKTCGTIQFAADSLAADTTSAGAAWTNTTIAATDVVVFTHSSGGTIGAYNVACAPGAGTATIYIRNMTAGALAEAPIFRYAVIKAVVA